MNNLSYSTPSMRWNVGSDIFEAIRVPLSGYGNGKRQSGLSFWRIYKNGEGIDHRRTRELVRRYKARIQERMD